MKYIILLIAFMMSGTVSAKPPHKDITVINQEVNEFYTSNYYDVRGAELAYAASQHHFDWSTNKFQISLGAGVVDYNGALSIGIAKRKGDKLLNGSFSYGSGKSAAGFGATWRF